MYLLQISSFGVVIEETTLIWTTPELMRLQFDARNSEESRIFDIWSYTGWLKHIPSIITETFATHSSCHSRCIALSELHR